MSKKETNSLRLYPRYLWFFILFYSICFVFSNWYDARLIKVFTLVTDAGTLIFPLTFILSDLITEVYGYKFARIAIWCGFLFNMLFISFGHLITLLPSPDFATQNTLFDTLLHFNTRVVFASIVSYFCAEPLNALLMAKLKLKSKGRFMGLRFISSTLVASGVDSFVFASLAFYGLMTNHQLLNLILTMWFLKVAIEILGLPISVTIAKKLKRREGLDIYDKNTNFNLFSLDAQYDSKNNQLK